MTETNIMHRIMLAIGKACPNVRIFRNNVGMAWQGEVIKHDRKADILIMRNPRPLHAGLCQGSSDLIGWTTREITPDMVGQKIAIFTALEVKASTRATAEQLNFIQQVQLSGGIAGVARTDQEATNLVK